MSSVFFCLGHWQASQCGLDPRTGLSQALLHVGLGNGSFAQTAAQHLVFFRELAGDFEQAADALGQKLEVGIHSAGW